MPGSSTAPQPPVNHVQLAIHSKFQAMQAQMNQQQAQLDICQRKLEDHERAEQERLRKSADIPWYRRTAKQLGRLTSEGDALSKLRNLVARVINEAIWVRVSVGEDDDDASPTTSNPGGEQVRSAQEAAASTTNEHADWAKLLHPGEVRRLGESASWPCNFTIKSSAGCNLALRNHLTTSVRAALDNESINKTAIPGCPNITVAAIEHVYKKRFDYLAANYKAQTQAEAMIRLAEKQHKARVTDGSQKYNLRWKGIRTFKRLHKGLDPTPYVQADWMSGEESAGEDEGLKTFYYDRANVPEERRRVLKPPKILGTQELAWRAEVFALNCQELARDRRRLL
ncbi:hypothetical protein AURDEDRAFT_174240 [Auricularia subglabra TFB-10046 SS5]|uniref:Uncharacterized protein n=1 Tax=Auricularia subglabra (strain TFB-10046 / SS5) TaxID=717982 RepID=J0WV11_AURST|nr:hypothetical protein AURDEDRAFT_174240 [Auricularia subglabra TFB-10046 SS5]